MLRRPVGEALLFLQLIPVMLPTTIAAYAVIGERERRTRETVLTDARHRPRAPDGKAIAAVLPTVAISWLLFGVYVGLARGLRARGRRVADLDGRAGGRHGSARPGAGRVRDRRRVLVSLRSSDFRVAQQLAVLAAAPVIVFVALVTFRVIEPSVGLYVAAAAAVLCLDVVFWRLGVRLFSRERLLVARRTAA